VTSPERAPSHDTIDWQRALGSIGSSKSFRYDSTAARAVTGAAAASQPDVPVESELAKQASKAARPDCRQSQAQRGLLAIPGLVLDTVTQSGCRW
jgi:hypothetical protein